MAGTVAVGDFDRDGQPDLFIGGRVSPSIRWRPAALYCTITAAALPDVTRSARAALERRGMITGAVWTDLDNDQQPDLVIAGEWMQVRFSGMSGGS